MKRSAIARSVPLARTGKPKAKRAVKKRAKTAGQLRKEATTLWGRYIHARDVYCQYCGKGGGLLNAHHILPREMNATRTDEGNGVLLCARPCHLGVMHGDPFAAVQFYTRLLGVEGYEALRQKARDGLYKKYPVDYWRREVERLSGLLGALDGE